MNETDPIQHYTNPRTGYWGKGRMYKKYKMILNNLYAVQRHRRITKPMRKKQFKRISAAYPFQAVQADLAFLPKLRSPLNNNVWGFMVVIDVFTKYLWVKTFTNRKALHIPLENILQQMRRDFGKTPETMTADNEFATTRLQDLAARYDFKWYFADPHEKYRTGVGERVIGTIKDLIKRYITQNNTTKYIDVLSDLVYNYNDTIHRATNTRPSVAIKTGQTFPQPRNKVSPLKIGDRVRYLEHRTKLTKGDVPYYSKNVYIISGLEGNRYILTDPRTNETLRKRYGRHQLYKIRGDVRKDKYNNSSVEDGYDEGIARNSRRNRNSSALNREGIDLNQIDDPVEREEAIINAGLEDQYFSPSESDEGSDFGRIDDISSKWDKLRIKDWIKKPTNTNGACLFNSIAGFIYWEKHKKILKPRSKKEKHLAKKYREQAVEYIRNNFYNNIPKLEQTFEDNIKQQLRNERDERTPNLYLHDMKQTWAWGGQAEIIALSLSLKRNIIVYVKRRNKYKKHGGYLYNENDDNIITLFWNQRNPHTEGTHYEYLIPKKNKILSPQLSPQLREIPEMPPLEPDSDLEEEKNNIPSPQLSPKKRKYDYTHTTKKGHPIIYKQGNQSQYTQYQPVSIPPSKPPTPSPSPSPPSPPTPPPPPSPNLRRSRRKKRSPKRYDPSDPGKPKLQEKKFKLQGWTAKKWYENNNENMGTWVQHLKTKFWYLLVKDPKTKQIRFDGPYKARKDDIFI